jgi:oxygen-independent coproporphyrinogen-3 oxidase
MIFNAQVPFKAVYIHWPFCPYRCHFCPFVALASHDQYMDDYHKALCTEIKTFGKRLEIRPSYNSIFMGGGTPSTYPPHLLLDMFDTLYNIGDLEYGAEVTIEVNPGTVSKEALAAWSKAGINRLSIGVQSLKDDVLQGLNRHQSYAQVLSLLDMASATFDNISIDLILGLPGVSPDEWQKMIETIVHWPIKHLSVYFLTVHENTPLYYGVKAKKVMLPPDDSMISMFYWTIDTLAQHGFEQYEISNYARKGYQSKHNSAYWERVPYKAFGLGACGFDGASRFQNTKNLMDYLKNAGSEEALNVFSETLTPEQAWLEKLMLGLRQRKGVRMQPLIDELTHENKQRFIASVDELIAQDLLEQELDMIRFTPKGLAVENEIIVKLSV